jgi:hypothetical protein
MRFNEGSPSRPFRVPIPVNDGPIYKEIPNTCSYFPGSYFPTVINSTRVVLRDILARTQKYT